MSYSIFFALTNTIEYDEAYSYLYYSNTIHGFTSQSLANNHPLNSLLIYFSSYFFPYSEFMIRLPNLIFLILYLLFAIKISCNTKIKLVTFGLLILYWYLIPYYFAQARGYGIASSFVLISLYYLLNKPSTDKNILISITLLLIGSYAFLGLIPLIISAIIYYFVFEISRPIIFVKKRIVAIASIFCVFVYLVSMLISVSEEGKPLYGSYNSSFLSSTIGFYTSSFFDGNYKFGSVATNMKDISSTFGYSEISLFTCLIFFIFFVSTMLFKKKKNKVKVSLITLFCFTILYFSSLIMNKPFITGRSLLPFYPLIALSTVEIIEASLKCIKSLETKTKFKRILILIFFVALTFNYFNKIEVSLYDLSFKTKNKKIIKILEGKPNPRQLFYQKKESFVKKKID